MGVAGQIPAILRTHRWWGDDASNNRPRHAQVWPRLSPPWLAKMWPCAQQRARRLPAAAVTGDSGHRGPKVTTEGRNGTQGPMRTRKWGVAWAKATEPCWPRAPPAATTVASPALGSRRWWCCRARWLARVGSSALGGHGMVDDGSVAGSGDGSGHADDVQRPRPWRRGRP